MVRKGRSYNHEGPSYKVHDHPHTSIYKYIYVMHNAITQSEKVKQTLQTFQGYDPTRYRKCKIDVCHTAHTQGMRPKQSAGMIKDTWGGNLNT